MAETKAKMIPTKYMLELRKKIMEERNVTETTVNNYLNNLFLINDRKSFSNLTFLKKDKERILEYLKEFAEATQIAKLSAMVVALSTVKENHLYKTTHKFFSTMLNEKLGIRDEEDEKAKTLTKDEEAEKWVSWDEVKSKWEALKEKVDEFKNDKFNSLVTRQFESMVDYLILSLYVLQPPRRNNDFLHMFIVTKNSGDLDKNANYADMVNKKFIYNVYKTAKHHGQEIVPMSDSLHEVLSTWLKFHPGNKSSNMVKLFVNREGTPQTGVNYITLRLNKIFKKKIGATQLRHIYISNEFKDIYSPEIQEKMKRVAEEMGHSVSEQKKYYRSVAPSSDSSDEE
jgi:integrase